MIGIKNKNNQSFLHSHSITIFLTVIERTIKKTNISPHEKDKALKRMENTTKKSPPPSLSPFLRQ
jgi:hypothetical protein